MAVEPRKCILRFEPKALLEAISRMNFHFRNKIGVRDEPCNVVRTRLP